MLKGAAATGDNDGTNLTNIKSVATVYFNTCAVSNNNNAYCWGGNGWGQLGDGTGTTRTTPVRVLKGEAATGDNDGTNLTNIKSISAGGYAHTCAVSEAGNSYCWGAGRLGNNTTNSSNIPIRTLKGAAATGDNDGTNLTNIKSIIARGYFSCAVSNNNNMYCWGKNDEGNLGDDTTTERLIPIRVLKGAAASGDNDGTYLTNIKNISTGVYDVYDMRVCAVSNNNNPYCWGGNSFGTLGDGTATQRNTPVRVLKGEAATGDNDGTNLTNIKSISISQYHACAVSEAGNSYCWGYNSNGQLGNDNDGNSYTPLKVYDPYPANYLMLKSASGYYSSGTFTSGILSLIPADWGNLSWTKTGTGTITMKARSCASNDPTCASATAWASCGNITSGSSLKSGSPNCVTDGHPYIQYQASLSGDTVTTPSLDDVTITYAPSPQTLTSPAYNTNEANNQLSQLEWDENADPLPSGTTVTVSLSTASTQGGLGTWYNFTNADCTTVPKSGTHVTCTTANLTSKSSTLTDRSADQWVQYKVTLTSTGASTPTFSNILLTYDYNTVPVLSTFAISGGAQDSSGNVNITYNLSDDVQTTLETLLFYEPNSGLTVNNNNGTPNAGIVDTGTSNITLNNNPKVTLPTAGSVMIDNELISYTGKTEPSGTTTALTGVSRGQSFNTGYATTATTHTNATRTYVKATAASGTGYGTVTGISTTPASKAITWIPKNESNLVGATYAAMSLKIVTNDGQAYNNISSITYNGALDNFAADVLASVISSVAPATSAYINSITSANGGSDVSYTLSEAITSGTIVFTRTGGTADASSPRTCTLKGTALNTGAHSNLDLSDTTNACTVAQSLVDGTIYTMALNATDLAGNAATQVSNTSVAFDTTAPTFTTQYYSDTNLTNSLGTNPRLKAGTYYIKISANEALGATPTVSIAAEGTANDMTDGTTVLASGNDYKYIRTIASDAAAIGTVIEDFSITGTDSASNTATNINPTDEATKAGYTDTTAPIITSISSNKINGSYKAGEVIDIDLTFSENITTAGTVTVTLETGTTDRTCTFSGVANSSTATCDYTVQAGDTSLDLTVNTVAGTIADQAGNAMTNFAPAINLATDKDIVIDTTIPVISSVVPAASAYINSITSANGGSDVSYTLSEAITSGTIVFTRTGGTADGTTHTCTLKGTALNTGAHSNLDLSDTTNACTVAQSLVDGTIYTMALNATDLAGNAATQVSNTSITFDTTIPVISSVAPAASAYINSITSANGGSDVSYTLSEAITSGTIVFTRTGGTADGTTHTCTLKGTALNTGAHSNLDLSDTTNACTSAQSLVDGTVYTMTLNVTDLAGNAATQVSNTSVTFDTTAPTLSSIHIQSNNSVNTKAKVGDTITLTFTGSEALTSLPTVTIAGHSASVVNPSGNNYSATYMMVSGDTEGAVAFTINFSDLAGNNGTQVTTTSDSSVVTFDKTSPVLQSFTSSSTNSDINDPLTMYGTNDTINVQAVFNEDLKSGSTMIVKFNNTAERQVTLDQISGSTLYGTYTVNAPGSGLSDDSSDLSISQIMSTGVYDVAGNLKSSETIPSGENLGDNKDLIVDTVPPSLSSFSATTGNYNAGDAVTIIAHYNKSVKAGSQIHVKINADSGTATIDLTTIATSTISGTYTVQAGDNTQNLKVDSIVSQSVYDIKNNHLDNTDMPGINIADGAQIDTTAPVASFTDDINADPNQSDSVTINVTETNPSDYKYVLSDDTNCSAKNYTSGTAFTSDTPFVFNTQANNGKYICAKAADLAGNTHYLASANTFNIDITPPTGTMTANRSLSSGQIQITAADPGRDLTGMQMEIAVFENDANAVCNFDGASWVAYADAADLASSAAIVKVCAKAKDAAGNISAEISTVPPRTPESFQYYDVSDPDDFRSFLSWKIPTGAEGSKGFYQYQLFKCVVDKEAEDCAPDTSGSADVVVTSEPTNYHTYLSLSDENKYCYQVRFASHNIDGSDYSALSNTHCMVPSAASSSITKDVAIEFSADPVPDSELFANEATIHWTTVNANDGNEQLPADSQVCWRVKTTPVPNWNCRSYESYELEHALTISKATSRMYDLAPDTEYEYQARSETSWGKIATADGPATFTTKNGPVIKNIQAETVSNTSATITWTTENKNGEPLLATSTLYYTSMLDGNGAMIDPIQATDCDITEIVDHTCTLGGTPETVLSIGTQYYFYVESVANGATARDTSEGAFFRFTTLSDATPPVITPNVGNPLIVTDTQAAVSWETDERATSWIIYDESSHDAFSDFAANDFDPADTEHNPYTDNISNDNNNLSHTFVMELDALNPHTLYHYRLVSEDASGNVAVTAEESFETLDIQVDHPDLVNPGDPVVAQYGDTEAVIVLPALNTDATSKLCWGTSIIDMNNCGANFDTIDTATKTHYYKINNLTPNDTYYVKTTVTDSETPLTFNFTSSDGVTFTTKKTQIDQHDPFTTIENIENSLITDENAVVDFTTDQIALCLLEATTAKNIYENPLIYHEENYAANENFGKNHSISLTGLILSTDYYYRITCHDNLNTTITQQDDDTQHLATLSKQTNHPVLTNPGNPTVTQYSDTEAIVTLPTTNATSTSKLCWGESEISNLDTCTDHQEIDTPTKTHAYHLTSLTPNTTYYIKTKVSDEFPDRNSVTQSYTSADGVTFTTLEIQTDHPDLTDPGNPTVTQYSDTEAIINIPTTNTPATSKLCYSETEITDMDTCTGYSEILTPTRTHSFHLSSLTANTLYHLKTKVTDSSTGSISFTSTDITFTTKEQLYTASQVGELVDSIAPVISSVATSAITGESVTVKWDTDENSNSMVSFGIKSETYDNGASNYDVNSDPANYVTAHEVIVNSLIPGTKYYFIASSIDASGNIAKSDEQTFTTKATSNISSIKAVSTKLGEITITWETSAKTTSVVEYGETTSYGEVKESSTYATDHEVSISGLKQNTEYHFMVKGKDQDNNVYASGDNSFTPKSPPEITSVKTADVTEHGVIITFITNVPTDALVTYIAAKDQENTGSQGKPDLETKHAVEIKNLDSGIDFTTSIKVRDQDGNETTQAGPNFTTGKDSAPPKIDQVRTDSALAQNDKVQTIVSWITDEPANTLFIYKEGNSGEQKEVKINSVYSTSHVAVVTIFKPGTVYYFKVKSVDPSDNVAVSSDFALLTPKNKENIIQIIIKNFSDIFGWARFK
ncbi:MAG: hypothetical protein WCX17_02055 [Parcubacteria group bacterium]